mgnify:CR=1 FL=1
MKTARFIPVPVILGFLSASCGTPRLKPEETAVLKPPLIEASRVACRGPLVPAILAGPGGILLAQSRTGFLQAIDPEKSVILWTVPVGSGALPPVVSGDRIVAAWSNGRVAGLDAAGREVWSVKFSKPIADPLGLAGGKIIVRDPDGWLAALNPADGSAVWKIPLPAADGWTSAGDRIVVRTGDGRLRLFSSEGRPDGEFQVGGKAGGDFCLVDGRILLGFAGGTIGLFDPAKGSLIWRQRLGGVPVGAPAFDGRNLYLVLSNHILAAFHLRSGDILYWKPLAGRAAYRPLLAGSIVFVASRSPRLQAFEAVSGAAKAPYEAGGDVLAAPVILGTKIFLARNGETEQEDIVLALVSSPAESPAAPAKTEPQKSIK